MEDAALGVAQVPKALTRPPEAFLELLNPPEEDVPMEEHEKELPVPRFPSAAAPLEEARLDTRKDAKWQRRRELMAKVKEQASSEAAPPPEGSRRASTSSAMTRWRATSLASIRPLQAKDVQRLLRGGPATSSSVPRWTSASWPPTRWPARTRTRPASRTSSPPPSGR